VRNIWPNWSYGFNTRYDTIRGVNKLPVFSLGGSNNDIFLINPVIAFQRYVTRDITKHKQIGWDGVTVRSMGSIVSSDTNERYPLSREATAQQFMKIADFERENLGHAMVDGPNIYTVGHTERVYSAPEQSLDAFGDTPVPLYHIALNGLVTRTTGSFYAVNMRNDPKTELLRQIEYNIQPVYLLTHQPSSDLIRTQANWLFTSQYEEWIDPAVKEYKQMRDEFGYLNGLFITNHEMLDYQVDRVTYEDGSQLIVNYNPAPYNGNGVSVGAYGYVLKKGSSR